MALLANLDRRQQNFETVPLGARLRVAGFALEHLVGLVIEVSFGQPNGRNVVLRLNREILVGARTERVAQAANLFSFPKRGFCSPGLQFYPFGRIARRRRWRMSRNLLVIRGVVNLIWMGTYVSGVSLHNHGVHLLRLLSMLQGIEARVIAERVAL